MVEDHLGFKSMMGDESTSLGSAKPIQTLVLLELSIGYSSINNKVERWKLAVAIDICFIVFGTHQQSVPTEPGKIWALDPEGLETNVSECSIDACFWTFQTEWHNYLVIIWPLLLDITEYWFRLNLMQIMNQ